MLWLRPISFRIEWRWKHNQIMIKGNISNVRTPTTAFSQTAQCFHLQVEAIPWTLSWECFGICSSTTVILILSRHCIECDFLFLYWCRFSTGLLKNVRRYLTGVPYFRNHNLFNDGQDFLVERCINTLIALHEEPTIDIVAAELNWKWQCRKRCSITACRLIPDALGDGSFWALH